ncbi:MAG TPA: hypothetical protein VE441_08485 [Mycobacterium sp.]|nr:hypothetical protein [Mycobacterium sp.]
MKIPGRRHLAVRAEEEFRKGGWGPLRTFPAARADGAPLVFQLRIPVAIELVELGEQPESVPGARELARRGAAALGLTETPVLIGALVPKQADASGELLATLTVSLPDLPWPPELNEADEHDAEGRPVANIEVTRLSEKAIRVKRLSVQLPEEGREPLPELMIQYFIQTRYGPVSMVFCTNHAEMFGNWGRELFQKIMLAGYLGERPAPY